MDLSSLKNNSICQRSEYNSTTSRTESRRSFVIRIFTSSGVAVLRFSLVVEKTSRTSPTECTSSLFPDGRRYVRGFAFGPIRCGDRRRYTAYLPCPGASLMVCRDHVRPILQERTHLRPLPFRAGQDALGVARKNPRVAAVLASLADHFGVVSRIAQHDHLRPFRQRQFANQIGRRLGCGAMRAALLACSTRGYNRASRTESERPRE